MAQKNTVYLIDGSSYIFRAYHAIRILSNSKGFPTNAIYGFTNMLLKFIKEYDPKYIGVVFDSKGDNFRNAIYPEYKANRGEPPDDLKPQFEEIFGLVKAFNMPMVLMEGYEADDIIGTLAKRFESENMDVVIVTGDKDFTQIVDDSITLLDTMKGKVTETKDVVEKYGVEPQKITEIFALTGDSIDNIPGVKGIGGKTASALIQEYGSLENIYNNLDKLKPRQKELLESAKDNALLSRELVTIKSDIEMPIDLNEYEYTGFNKEKLIELFKEYEFSSLLKELDTDSKDKIQNWQENKADSRVSYDNYKLITNEKDFETVLELINTTKSLSIDLETTSQLPMEAEILGFVLCPRPHESYYVPVGHRNLLDANNQLALQYVCEKLKPIIEDEQIKKIGQNLKYEYVVLSNYGIELKGIYFDTIIAAHLIDSSRLSYSLDELSKIYLNHKPISYKEVTIEGRLKLKFEEVDIELAKTYACEDADVAYLLSDILVEKLKELDVLEVYNKYLLDLIVVLAGVEISGVKIDTNKLSQLSKEFEKIILDTEKKVYKESGAEFNL
ncbi:MAG: DNA polymerase I, partial [Candidatus Dadabacteria bacterium]|nr:DNA polymerase I [Candidatus Dadabacteria bacterium]NIS07268.1 DNA polymerase I [Candidatus Dadabacteria bacterium]NIV40975.1 DNA polymerase I [Candidatus Dadabacteria bacterium]NIY21206.1 DNA polymerase I [Candidatus Dadabacteria bacterium]